MERAKMSVLLRGKEGREGWWDSMIRATEGGGLMKREGGVAGERTGWRASARAGWRAGGRAGGRTSEGAVQRRPSPAAAVVRAV